MFDVTITEPAEQDIHNAYEWWRDHRSADEAARWYENIIPAIDTLRELPDRCPLAPETDLYPSGLRELHFGIGRRPTHRIIFTIEGTTVVVLRVRHSAQRDLRRDDLQ
ncbi:MAG: type II toxin-antitoxin system RelE/ParE family toxin [Planctomycetaceae bacterium]